MDWIDFPQILRLFAALAFVIALMAGLAYALRRMGLAQTITPKSKSRLKIIETLNLDARRRLAIIQRDDTQHLIILGTNTETLIETNFEPVQNKEEQTTTATTGTEN